MKNKEWDYKIDGKMHGLARIIIVVAAAIFFIVLTIDQLQPAPNKSLPLAIGFAVNGVIFLSIAIYLLNRYFFFKIYIGKDGFYLQSNPFDGKYYLYSDVERAEEKMVANNRSHANGTSYYYYFIFIFKNRTSKKVQFEKSIHEREFNVLKERINNQG